METSSALVVDDSSAAICSHACQETNHAPFFYAGMTCSYFHEKISFYNFVQRSNISILLWQKA